MSQRGQRTSFKTPRYRGKAKVDLQNQFVGAACGEIREFDLKTIELRNERSRVSRELIEERRIQQEVGPFPGLFDLAGKTCL